jgi:hypothetical protein
MSALADQILAHLEQRAFDEDVRLDQIDEFVAAELRVPVAGLYAYLLLCFAAERYAVDRHGGVDAAAAQGERARRRSRNAAQAEREYAQVTAWCRRTLGNDAAPQTCGTSQR